ncbi:MAG: phosphatidate phosphatase App1 family protein, partial [Planctomycetia bacterium]
VAGMVTRPLPLRSRRRVMAMAVLKRILDLDEVQLESEVFQRRADAFLFQRVAGQPVRITIGDRLIDVGQTDRTGHFRATFDIDGIDPPGASGCPWISYSGFIDDDEQAGLGDTDAKAAASTTGGRIQLIGDDGLSVISDIDDTVKVTNVANRRELLANTFVREFRAVPGIVGIYQRWQEEPQTAFHYVSASPWQLARCLRGFLDASGLPAGSMHLKLFRLKDSTPLGRLPSRKRSKRRTIEQIIDEFPGRRFLLVGDSGERDPEVYAAVARRRPEQVSGILIRQVEGKAPREKIRSRLDRLARRLPTGLMRTFTEPEDLVG